MEQSTLGSRLKFVAQVVEKFVEQNIVEKEHRNENLKKLALAFETFVKENPLKQNFKSYVHQAASEAVQSEVKKSSAEKNAEKVSVKVKKLENFKGELPKYQSRLASGLDVRAQISSEIVLKAGQRALVPTGLSFAIPEGYEIQARPRSGWAIRDGISLLNTPGTIDADYRGEVKIILINLGESDVTIRDQDRIAQLVLCPVLQADFAEVESLDETERGAGGFGSTGR
jgi:dUTP pyrophosphatase